MHPTVRTILPFVLLLRLTLSRTLLQPAVVPSSVLPFTSTTSGHHHPPSQPSSLLLPVVAAAASVRSSNENLSSSLSLPHKMIHSFPKIPKHLLLTTTTTATKAKASNHHDGGRGVWQTLLPTTTPSTTTKIEPMRNIIYIHCIVLVHGWMGNSKELSYLQSQLIQQQQQHGHYNNNNNNDNNHGLTATANATTLTTFAPTTMTSSTSSTDNDDHCINNNNSNSSCVLVHSSTYNDQRTNDGIVAGGQRLADEINQWIQQLQLQIRNNNNSNNDCGNNNNTGHDATATPTDSSCECEYDGPVDETTLAKLQQQQQQPHSVPVKQYCISISLVGNSLGGLYARYALRDIQFQSSPPPPPPPQVQAVAPLPVVTVYPAVFCTTCTPHLGVGTDQSYMQLLPYHWMQRLVATMIGGTTGYDLFRIRHHHNNTRKTSGSSRSSSSSSTTAGTDVIQELTICDEYIRPLQQFYRRIAVCNTFGTDLQVPCSTAAFLLSPRTSSIATQSLFDESSRNNNNNKNNKESSSSSSLLFTDINYYQLSEWNNKIVNTTTSTTTTGKNHSSCISMIVETIPRLRNDGITTAAKVRTTTEMLPPSLRTSNTTAMSSNQLAHELDSLGWMKIFCDTRPYLPSIEIPTVVYTMWNFMTTVFQFIYKAIALLFPSTTMTMTTEERRRILEKKSPFAVETKQSTATEGNYSAREIWEEWIEGKCSNTTTRTFIATNHASQRTSLTASHRRRRWYLPVGHTVLVANAKSEWYGQLNAAGRPTMDQLAIIILQEIVQSTTVYKVGTDSSQ